MAAEERRGPGGMLGRTSDKNVHQLERAGSLAAGAALAGLALWRRGWTGVALALAGGDLLWRGASGNCWCYRLLGINTARTGAGRRAVIRHRESIKVERSITVERPVADLYRFWRQLETLPRFMDHLESVRTVDDQRSRWVAKAPAGRTVEWEAEIITERENELIGWRSLPGSEIATAGSVRFAPATGGRGTVVSVSLAYDPPAGPLGAAIARLLGEEPALQLQNDLRRFKQVMEAGEIATNEMQPAAVRELQGAVQR